MTRITKVLTWVPPFKYSQEDVIAALRLGENPSVKMLFRRCGVATRYFACPAHALGNVHTGPKLIPPLAEVFPGLPAFEQVVEVSNIGPLYVPVTEPHRHFRWCPGSIEALVAASQNCGQTLVVTCDLNSYLRWDPNFCDSSDAVAYSIMGDAISAVVVETDGAATGLEIVGRSFKRAPLELVGMREGKFYINPALPSHIPPLVLSCLNDLYGRCGVSQEEIGYWAVHPGGIRILDELERALRLDASALGFSRSVLRDYGNVASSSVFFVLKEILATHPPAGTYGVIVSFGPASQASTLLAGACLIRW